MSIPDATELTELCGRPVYTVVNLDSMSNNVNIVRSKLKNPNAVLMAVIKNNAYGLGMTVVGQHLKSIGVERLGVAIVEEGILLRNTGIQGPIHILGNASPVDMKHCVTYNLVPSVATMEAVQAMAKAVHQHKATGTAPYGRTIHIRLNTGMYCHGCAPESLDELVQACDDSDIEVEGIYTHLPDGKDKEFTNHQLEIFEKSIEPYRKRGMLFHVANSTGVLEGIGVEYDMVRVGSLLYGQRSSYDPNILINMGFKHSASMVGMPSLVQHLPAGTKIGYRGTYITKDKEGEWIVTLPMGYADGYPKQLSNKGKIVRDKTGELCDIVGLVTMDAITIKVLSEVSLNETFSIMTPDYDPVTSALGIAKQVGLGFASLFAKVPSRMPRIYVSKNGYVIQGMNGIKRSTISEINGKAD